RNDVVQLEPTNKKIESLRHIAPKPASVSPRQIVYAGKREAMPDVGIGIAPFEFRSQRIVRTTVSRAGAVGANAARRVIDCMCPSVSREEGESFTKSPLKL